MIWGMQRRLTVGLFALAATGCSTVGATVVRTRRAVPAWTGPVAIYVAATPPPATDLGRVEVHGDNYDGAVEVLVPVFAQHVAALGGNAAVIESIDTRFETRVRVQMETYTYQCGFYTCTGTRAVPMPEEVAIVTMRGHALSTTGSGR
jgi:hypothetical protein